MQAFEAYLVQCLAESKHLTCYDYHHSHSIPRDDVGSFSRNISRLQEKNICIYMHTEMLYLMLCSVIFSE